MKVLNLQCALEHSFEGWFASEQDFQSQLLRGLVECPLCADKGIQKMPSAPRLNLGSHQAASQSAEQGGPSNLPAAPVQSNGPAAAQAGASLAEQSNFLKALRQVLANTEDVGGRFADEARRMHYGDIEARSIRGQTSVREAVELMEEGIDVMPLPMPAALKETLQ
jgi:hypothetical protein